ncbi:MAG: hypothetical protein AAGC93_21580 [Cyanobacteria bacterium P01_F01_bin.53]
MMTDFNQAKVLQILQSAISAQQELNQAILNQLANLQAEKSETQWVPLDEGVRFLGPAFSSRKILDDIKAGYLKYGVHYIDTSNGNRPTYAVRVSSLRKVYEIPPEKRQCYLKSA